MAGGLLSSEELLEGCDALLTQDANMPQMLVDKVREDALVCANTELTRMREDFRALREQYDALQAERDNDQQRFSHIEQEHRFEKARGNVARSQKQAASRKSSEGRRQTVRAITPATSPVGVQGPGTTLPDPTRETLVAEQEVPNDPEPLRNNTRGSGRDGRVDNPEVGAVTPNNAIHRMADKEDDWVGEWGGNGDVGTV